MNKLLLATFLSSALLLKTPDLGDDDTDQNGAADNDGGADQEGQGGQESEGTQHELTPEELDGTRRAAYRMARGDPDEHEPSSPEDLAFLESVGPYGQTIADGYRKLAEADRVTREAADAERAKTDREARKATLRSKLADDRAVKAKEDADAQLDQELLAEVAAENAAGDGRPTTTPADIAVAIVNDVVTRIDELHSKPIKPNSPEERELGELAKAGTDALGMLEGTSPDRPVHIDETEFLARVNAELEKRKGK